MCRTNIISSLIFIAAFIDGYIPIAGKSKKVSTISSLDLMISCFIC